MLANGVVCILSKYHHSFSDQSSKIEGYIPILYSSALLEAAAETRRHLKGIELSHINCICRAINRIVNDASKQIMCLTFVLHFWAFKPANLHIHRSLDSFT